MQWILALILLFVNLASSWDIAITHGDQIEFYTNSSKTSNEAIRFRELTALAYDAVHNIVIFVDKQNDNASIFSYNLATKKYQSLVKRKIYENIQGIAFDPIHGLLFWTDTYERSIFSLSVAASSQTNAYGNLLLKMDEELPRAIAVDSCRGYIYWTNTNITKPTIERCKFDGSEREIIIDQNIYMPVSIAIDQSTGRLYWADDKEGIHYSIESTDLNGKDRKTLIVGQFHQPNTLTVSKDSIYWIEWGFNSVWKYPKTPKKDEEPEKMFSFVSKLPLPFGIVANYNIEDQTKGVAECDNLYNMAQNKTAVNESFKTVSRKEGLFCLHGEVMNGKLVCKCSPGYVGERCEQSVCQNYCLEGDCSLTTQGNPVCSCKIGYTGQRCEINQCLGYCINDGICSVDQSSQKPNCKCATDFQGLRCEIRKTRDTNAVPKEDSTDCNCTNLRSNQSPAQMSSEFQGIMMDTCENWDPIRDPILMVLGVFSGLLCVLIAFLVTKILHLRRRPRIKKRIIVNKNVTPLTARPDQCEITIENCCNMNICETPCFEPRNTIRPTLMDTKPGKEERKNLIANMEQEDY